MRITCTWSGHGQITTTVTGELDLAGAPRLDLVFELILGRSATEPPLGPRPGALIVDLSKVRLLSTAALNVLYAAHQLAAAVGVRLRIVTGLRTSPAARVLRLTGLASVLDVYPTVSAISRPARGISDGEAG